MVNLGTSEKLLPAPRWGGFSLSLNRMEKRLIVITGPTAVGKTHLAIQVAQHYKTEIISADARQIYLELEIGTAKPLEKELQQVKHHFINCRSVQEDYDAGQFGRDARVLADLLFQNHSQVVVCGGSGLYIKSLVEGFDDLPDVPAEIRSQIIATYHEKGLAWLQGEVATHDPEYFGVVDRRNPQRLMRALEIIHSTEKKFSGFLRKEKITLPFDVIKIGLELDRKELYDRIDKRMDGMIEDGLFEEAKRFFEQRHLNSLQTVGYQEAFEFFDGKIDREEAVRLMKQNTRHYAKRQLTWFKKDKSLQWFHPDDMDGVLKLLCEPRPLGWG